MARWFRWYRGTTENPKFRLAARNGGVTLVTVMAVWQAVLEDAANPDHRGVCRKRADFIAAALDLPDDAQAEAAICGLEYAGLVSIVADAIMVCDWKKWQYEQDVKDPTNARRQQRFRDGERARNGGVTARNDPDTDTDTEETFTDVHVSLSSAEPTVGEPIEIKPAKAKSSAQPENPDLEQKFEEFRQAYPRREGQDPRKPARQKFEALVKSGVDPGRIIAGAAAFAADEARRGSVGTRFIPHSAVWLNQRRFEDALQAVPGQTAMQAASQSGPTQEWVNKLTRWRDKGDWPGVWGPPPGAPGCTIPADVIAQFRPLEAA